MATCKLQLKSLKVTKDRDLRRIGFLRRRPTSSSLLRSSSIEVPATEDELTTQQRLKNDRSVRR